MALKGPGADVHETRQLGAAEALLVEDLLEKRPGKFTPCLEKRGLLGQSLLRKGLGQPGNIGMGDDGRFGERKCFLDLHLEGFLVLTRPKNVAGPGFHGSDHMRSEEHTSE